jgi:FkbM family methyltransferase
VPANVVPMGASRVLLALNAPWYKIRHKLSRANDELRTRLGIACLRHTRPASRARAVHALLASPINTQTRYGPIRFLNHSPGSCKRAEGLLTKEPDSLKWIDAMAPGSVFWDIGANIGTLSLYAAARGDLDVWAFEPAAVNYYNLAANCELNGCSGRMHCLQIGFGETNEIAELHVSQFLPAQSFSFTTFKKKFQRPPSRQTAQLWSIDDFIDRYNAPCPNYIKIDVPSLTMPILVGANRTLARPELRQIQIEADEYRGGGRRVGAALAPFGFEIVARNMKSGGTRQGDLVYGRVTPAPQARGVADRPVVFEPK